jgi:NAD-dependent dihydropyrimidine dehydrogenase PreA subunit
MEVINMAWFTGYPREKIQWYPTIDDDKCVDCGMCMNCGGKVYKWTDDGPVVDKPYKCVVGCTTCATLCQGNAITFPDKKALRELYQKERIWAKVKKELTEEGRLKQEDTTEDNESGCCETAAPQEVESQGCCGGTAETPFESPENPPEEDSGCGCGCGADYTDESVKNNPTEPKTQVDDNFIQKLEDYAHSIGIKSIGYTKVPPKLINEGNSILFPNAIVLTMEMDDELIITDPGTEAQALNDAHYEKLGNMTYQISDYLRENGFAAEAAHPYGNVVSFSPLGQTAGLGWIGQSGLLITPASGPRQKISAIFTNIENLPMKDDDEHSWIEEYCNRCGKCIKACPEKALIETETCCGGKETQFVESLCIGCSEGCTYCIEDCPFDQKEYMDIKNRFDRMNAKLAEKRNETS